jgi:hypothetical protein
LDEEIDYWRNERVFDYLFVAGSLCLLAAMEWYGYLTHMPRHPLVYSGMALFGVGVAAWRLWGIKAQLRQLRLGRDGERCVGQFLERLREDGGQVFHDVPAEGFNLDHVVISRHGIFAIETKTWTKPWPKATITVDGDQLLLAGRKPDRNPMDQAAGGARWLEGLLAESTGKQFGVRGVVVFPRWWIEQRSPRGAVWVLEPKALPEFIRREPESIIASDVALASSHLSRYVRSAVEKQAR